MNRARRRDNTSTLLRRTERARQLGWTSYGQRRYWEARWSRQVAERLARTVCEGHLEDSRQGSIMCASCNAQVNPLDRRRHGDWRARLVNTAAARRRRKPSEVQVAAGRGTPGPT